MIQNYIQNTQITKTNNFSKEFSAFNENSLIVENMVNYDEPYFFVEYFYGINNVIYSTNFIDAVKTLKIMKKCMICVHIDVLTIENNHTEKHSIMLIKMNKKYYLFDPNGSIDENSSYFYICNNEYMTTKHLKLFLFDNFNIHMNCNEKGPQVYCNFLPNEYISEGGYCMFFNFLFAKNLNEDKYTIHELMNENILEMHANNIHIISKLIIDSITNDSITNDSITINK